MSNNNDIKKVIVIGASGNLGAIVLSALREAKAFEITVLTRPSSNNSFPADVTVVKTTYSESELVDIFRGHDAVISTVGATGFAEQKSYVDAAIKAGVKRFLPSELSANTLSEKMRELVPIFEVKKELLEYLKEKEATGLTWTGLATGPLADWGISNGMFGFDLKNQKATIWDEGKTVWSATNQGDVGRAVVSILQHPTETANQYLFIQTLATSQGAILQSLEKATGKKWTVEHVETSVEIAKARQSVSQGEYSGLVSLLLASVWGDIDGKRSNFAVDEKLANSVLGLPERDLDEIVKSVVARLSDSGL